MVADGPGLVARRGVRGALAVDRRAVLVVDDEPAVRELVVGVLSDEGYEVVEAVDGAEAIQALDTQRPPAGHLSVVLLDMMLPRVDGAAVLRHLTERGDSVPVVAMSASPQHLAVAAASGAQVTLAKPFDLAELLTVVERCCAPHS